jgi:dTDP-4-amino-4,6-dideoxygalactose transaminase
LFLIADAAHSAGLAQAANFGDAAAFSFYGNKNMTTAEGGMVVSNRPEVLGRARQMRSHGMTSGTFQRHQRGAPRYDVTMLGYNYRMDELRAALGLIQLGHLAVWNERRRELVARYTEALATACPTILVPELHGSGSAHHIMPIVLPADIDRDGVIASLHADNIQTSIHYPPVHTFSFYKTWLPRMRLPKTEEFCRRELTLPLHPAMHDQDVERVVSRLVTVLSQP